MFSRITLSTFSHLVTRSRVVIQIKSFPQNRSLHSFHGVKDINSKISYLNRRYPHSSVFNTNFVRFTSTTEAAKIPVENALPQVPDPPSPPEISEIVGEATLESMGLGGYLPIGLLQKSLFWIHTQCGFPWWTTIVFGTLGLKIALFPLFLKTQRHQALTQVYKDDLSYFERKKKESLLEEDQVKAQLYSTKQETFFLTHNMMTFKQTLLNYSMQGFTFITFFMALNGLSNPAIQSMKEGGVGWLSDLTVPDPYYILPLISALSSAIIIYLLPSTTPGIKPPRYIKYLKFIVPVVSFPIFTFFKSSVLIYIITSSWLTFLSQALIRIPKFRAFCKVPFVVKPDPKIQELKSHATGTENEPIIDTIKSTWKGFRRSRAYGAAYNLDRKSFEAAGRGAVIKTYKFDPTRVIASKRSIK